MKATLPPCAGPITNKCGRHREVETGWLCKTGWNVSNWCHDCGAIRFWYRITWDNMQQALDPSGLVVSEQAAV